MHEEPDDEAAIWRAAAKRMRDPAWRAALAAGEEGFLAEMERRDRPYKILADTVTEAFGLALTEGTSPAVLRLGLLEYLLKVIPVPQGSGNAAENRKLVAWFAREYRRNGDSEQAREIGRRLQPFQSSGPAELSDAPYYLYDLVANFAPREDSQRFGPLPDRREPDAVCFVKALVTWRYFDGHRLELPEGWQAVIEEEIRVGLVGIT